MTDIDITPNHIGDWALIALIVIQVVAIVAFAVLHSRIAYGYVNAAMIAVFWYLTEVVAP